MIKNKFWKTIKTFFYNFKQIKRDKENRKLWIKEMNLEIADPKSKFNEFHMSMSEDYNTLSCIFNLPDDYQLVASDIEKYRKLNEYANIINRYINNTLNWGEYLTAPNFFHIEDADDNETQSCSYLAVWEYVPILSRDDNKFWAQFRIFCYINLSILVALAILLI